MLVQANDTFNTSIGNVTFEPGTRNNWHKHPGGQILVVTDGVGYYQEKGKPIQTIRRGDVIQIPPDVVHWHGASHNSEMIHLLSTQHTKRNCRMVRTCN
jgi:quercetin dioxygenase-like cupin family protein